MEMIMAKKQLLLATFDDAHLREGLSYSLELAKTLGKDLQVLLVKPKSLSQGFEDLMAAVTFAEEADPETAKEMMSSGDRKVERGDVRLSAFFDDCREAGVAVEAYEADGKIAAAINGFIRKAPMVDMVLLGPTVAATVKSSAREFKKLVSTVSRPVVTMVRNPDPA